MTQEEFEGWSSQRETKAVREYLYELRENYTEQIHNILTNCNIQETIALQAARLQGMIIGLNSVLELAWEDIGGQDEN